MNYKYFLQHDINLLKLNSNKNEIINNENAYNFVYFCQGAQTLQLNALLDEEGINILLNSSNLETKFNGLITCNHDFNCLKNKKLCEKILEILDFNYIYGLVGNSAVDFFKYIKETNEKRMIELFNRYSDDAQIFLLDNMHFSYSEINKFFPYAKEKCAQYMLEKYEIFLYDISYSQLLGLADKKIKIPINCISHNLIRNIVSINDVKTYRFLIDKLSYCFDVSIIEDVRKKEYLKEISSVENGVLKKYRDLSNDLDNGEYADVAVMNNFGSFVLDNVLLLKMSSNDFKDNIKFESDFKLTNIIIDYLFEDVPTNVLLNIKNLLNFQKGEGRTLSDDDINLYTLVLSLDQMSSEEKINFFNKVKYIDFKTKFYNDYSAAKDKMVDLLNNAILNKENVKKYRNEEMSKTAGVDIYCLDGDKFMALVKTLSSYKSGVLNGDIFSFDVDGSSFSIDGSSKLNTYRSPNSYYNLAYTSIPIHQLVHSFPVDSFSKYNRDKKGLPDRVATKRINYLMTPDEFVSTSMHYTELIISVLNSSRDNENEFNSLLKNPEPFAIYCYDTVTENDIESAKKYGLGIIVVNTKKYAIDKTDKLQLTDTIGKDIDLYNYVTSDDDERKIRF